MLLSAQHLGPLSSFLSACTWAVGVTAYSAMAAKYSSPAVNFCRSLVALPLFCFLFLATSSEGFSLFQELQGNQWFWFTASVVGSFALGDTLFLLSTHVLGVPIALAIAAIYPIWSALGGWIFLKDPFHPQTAFGVLFIVSGTVMVILSENFWSKKKKLGTQPDLPVVRKYWLGVVLALATSLCWGLNAFALAKATVGLTPIFSNIVRNMISLVLCPLVGLVLYRRSFRLIPLNQLKAPLWIFVLEAFGGSLLYLYGISHAPLAVASVLSSLSPVVALCLGWILQREPVSWPTALSIGAVVFGIWLLASAGL